MKNKLTLIFIAVVFASGAGLILMENFLPYELFPYSEIVGIGACFFSAYLVSVVVAIEKPKVSKEDLSETYFRG